ncbi:hypothetical protein SAMN05444817_11711 [Corynebacterium appendicis CIP 107643]|uniref:Uncharacterized protein n=1 Tax=Corynebacterium appendicis CIP 107643 TaxID=1161099 RepID=A0A1N7KC36_9CORY|nr:hypothetical protein [Corynebacterium appendicis]WJY60841.1 hypothetical protein CAPP_04575 [Corynebacterium appendicis CIP 107643]SIS59151.1 hypothetical protein SAMN05444817_11711 [Corynebacterium appendicis CIP 107643]
MKYSSYPHPVVGNGNDVNAHLDAVEDGVVFHPLSDLITFEIPIKTDDPQIRDLVNTGEAKFVVSWDCAATLARGTADYKTEKTHYGWNLRFSLLQEEVRSQVEIDLDLVAATDLPNFHWQSQNHLYGSSTFSISKGDVLAVLSGFNFKVRKIYDAMDPPLGSLFRIITADIAEPMSVSYDSLEDQILIEVSESFGNNLQSLSPGQFDASKISVIVFPVLVDAINLINKSVEDPNQDDYVDTNWYQGLLKRIKELNLDTSNPLQTAQELLSRVNEKALAELIELQDGDL